jgi:hypothetical protein
VVRDFGLAAVRVETDERFIYEHHGLDVFVVRRYFDGSGLLNPGRRIVGKGWGGQE